MNLSSNPGGRSFPLASGCVTDVGAGSSVALRAGMDVGQNQDGASGVCVGEKGFRHSASHDAMWEMLKCHRS